MLYIYSHISVLFEIIFGKLKITLGISYKWRMLWSRFTQKDRLIGKLLSLALCENNKRVSYRQKFWLPRSLWAFKILAACRSVILFPLIFFQGFIEYRISYDYCTKTPFILNFEEETYKIIVNHTIRQSYWSDQS